MKKILFCLLALLSACVTQRSAGSFDGLSDEYPGDSKIFAEHVADELEHRYVPARTTIRLARANGAFGPLLEDRLREKGFAVSENTGMDVSYHIDVLDNDSQPTMGFVQVKAEDGQIFSFSREVFRGTTPPAQMPDRAAFNETSLATGAPDARLESPKEREPRPATVKKPGTAREVARRNRVNVADFCAWNGLRADSKIARGSSVWLKEPPAQVLEERKAAERRLAEKKAEEKRRIDEKRAEEKRQEEMKKKAEAERRAEEQRLAEYRKKAEAERIARVEAERKASSKSSDVSRKEAYGGTPNLNGARTYTVKKQVKAGRLADQLGIKRKDFFDWNNVGSSAEFAPGHVVFISKPTEAEKTSRPGPGSGSPGTAPAASTGAKPLPPGAPQAAKKLPVVDMNPIEITTFDNSSVQNWEVVAGTMLRSILENWTSLAGYTLIWNPDNDYEMRTNASFSGSFEKALSDLFAQLQLSGLALRATIYKGNNVLEISDH